MLSLTSECSITVFNPVLSCPMNQCERLYVSLLPQAILGWMACAIHLQQSTPADLLSRPQLLALAPVKME